MEGLCLSGLAVRLVGVEGGWHAGGMMPLRLLAAALAVVAVVMTGAVTAGAAARGVTVFARYPSSARVGSVVVVHGLVSGAVAGA
jgi:hypothetical protein